jgi:TolB-like protein
MYIAIIKIRDKFMNQTKLNQFQWFTGLMGFRFRIPIIPITKEFISNTSQLSFPQVKRVGNPNENKERFRTSRNDKLTNECGFTNDRISNTENFFLFLFLCIFLIAGCGPKHYVREKVGPANIKRVAVIPFENFTADEYAAEKIRRIVITDLLSRGVEVVEPGEITRIIRESKIKSISSIKTTEVQEIGKASGAYAIMTGSVEYYGIARGISVTYPEVTVNFKLMKTSTGKVLWSVRHTSGGADFWTRHFGSEGKSLSEAAGEVVREAMNTFF